jgi:hypothetical protein
MYVYGTVMLYAMTVMQLRERGIYYCWSGKYCYAICVQMPLFNNAVNVNQKDDAR